MKIESREQFVRAAILDGLAKEHFCVTIRIFTHYSRIEARMVTLGFRARRRWIPFIKPTEKERRAEADRMARFFTSAAVATPALLDEFSDIISVWIYDEGGHWRFNVDGSEKTRAADSDAGIILSVDFEKPRYFTVFLGLLATPRIPVDWLQERLGEDDKRGFEAMEIFRFDIQDGDEVWTYFMPPAPKGRSHFESGYALVRDRKPIKLYATIRGTSNEQNAQ